MSDPSEIDAAEARAEHASTVVYTIAHDDQRAAERIIELGTERIRSIQAAGVNLDTRTAQVAALQLAAAAFAAGIAASKDSSYLTGWLAAASSLLFVFGAGTALWAIQSCESQAAGIEPAYWERALDQNCFDDSVVLAWSAKVIQQAIETATRVDERRGRLLNDSIVLGLVASAMAFASGAGKVTLG